MSSNKVIAIVQSCYIPWKGYFDLINMVDEFILYDDVQFTRRDWRNRNMIKTPQGLQWLTIPVDAKGQYFQKINETKISDNNWAKKHWKAISYNYAKAPYFKPYRDLFEAIYTACEEQEYISQINYTFLKTICDLLNINTTLSWSTDYTVDDALKRTDRLLALCKKAQATHYVSGPSAQNYINETLFKINGIELAYIDYSNYPTYPQLYGEFKHQVSMLDVIFNTGINATSFLKTFSNHSPVASYSYDNEEEIN